jgi:hypothetical protein
MTVSLKSLVALLATAVALAGCQSNSSDNNAPAPTPVAQNAPVRFIHASADAPNVNVVGQLGQNLVADLGFKQVSPFQAVGVGTLNLRVDGIVPGGTATVIGPVDLDVAAGHAYSVIALGQVAAIDALVIDQGSTTVAPASVRARVVHAAPNAPPVDVYVTAPTDLLAQSVPLGSFAFGEQLGPVTVAAGDYRIRVTLPNDPATVVFDSGTVALPGSADLLIMAVQNTGAGAAPISLLVALPTSSFEILDTDTPAEVRVIHASPDAPAVDVIADDDFANPVLEDVPFPAFSAYLTLPAGMHNVKVTPANNAGVIVIDADLDTEAGKQYSVFATGTLASIAPYVLTDDNRRIATEAKVRIVHTAPGAGNVDIYVTAPGAGIASATPAFTNVPFRAETGYVSLAGGSYDVTVTPTGTKTAAIGPATITVDDGGVYTAAARDAAGGGAPFGLILMDDF